MTVNESMLNWQQLSDDVSAEEWDQALLAAHDYAVFQSYGWGEFKRASGWQPMRWIGRDRDGHIAAMVQFLLKKFPLGFGVAWAPGGPAMRFPNGAACELNLPALLSAMKQYTPRLLVRFDSYIPSVPELVDTLAKTCGRPSVPLSSGRSIQFDISDGEAGFVARMASKHRYYFRKANAAGLRWDIGASDRNIAALATLHRGMTEAKNLKMRPMDEAQYVALRDKLGASGMTIVTGYLDDRPITSCLALDFGRKSFYFVAASGPEGRKIGAAYAMVPQLIGALRQKGITHFDFGGVAPDTPGARGVDHFKKGFGGEPIAYLGEWEWASMPLLAQATGLLMRYRGMAA